MRVRKEANMPRGQGKVKGKRGKAERSGAWESEKEPSCPIGRRKVKRKRGKAEPSGAWE